MTAETGKVIILKDIHNVSAGVDARADKSKDLLEVVKELKKAEGTILSIANGCVLKEINHM